jgi:hypothetical protein
VLAAAFLAALLKRLSLITFEAAFAANLEVVSLGALLWVKALPAALLAVLLVDVLSVFDAAFAELRLVPFFIHLPPAHFSHSNLNPACKT